MLVYRLCKSTYIADPLSAEGARRVGGRWNPKGFPILYTSATPELAPERLAPPGRDTQLSNRFY